MRVSDVEMLVCCTELLSLLACVRVSVFDDNESNVDPYVGFKILLYYFIIVLE